VNLAGIEETVADKGYHSGAVVKRMKAYGVRSYIPEKKQQGRRNWAGKQAEQQAVYANRRRVRGEYGKSLLRRRGELVERSFAPCYETGGMRRCHLRGRENILKRQLVHVGAFNLSLILRQLLGAGTPRELKNRAGQAFWRFLRFLLCLMTTVSPARRLAAAVGQPLVSFSVAACLVTAREISVFCHGLLRMRWRTNGCENALLSQTLGCRQEAPHPDPTVGIGSARPARHGGLVAKYPPPPTLATAATKWIR
jgi:hypothetical protein